MNAPVNPARILRDKIADLKLLSFGTRASSAPRNSSSSSASRDPRSASSIWQKLLAGGVAGSLGIIPAQPFDIIKVRYQGDDSGGKPRYRSLAHAFRDIIREEGAGSLWRGVTPNISRSFAANAAELAAYDQSKDLCTDLLGLSRDSVVTQFLASLSAGFFGAVATTPIDVIKNRVLEQDADKPRYSGIFDCAKKTLRAEGPLGFYNGFFPNWMRLAPWATVMFLTYEQYRAVAHSLLQS